MRANQMPESSPRSPRSRSALRRRWDAPDASMVSTERMRAPQRSRNSRPFPSHSRSRTIAPSPSSAGLHAATATPPRPPVKSRTEDSPAKRSHHRSIVPVLSPCSGANAHVKVMLARVRSRIRPRRAAKERMTQAQAAALQRARAPAVRVERQERQPRAGLVARRCKTLSRNFETRAALRRIRQRAAHVRYRAGRRT